MVDQLPYQGIDTWDTAAILTAMNDEDKGVPAAVGVAIPRIAAVVDVMVAAIGQGGHVHYFGAGTSGRLAVLDAYECPPTFDVAPTVVQAHLAGGNLAFAHQMENLEDDAERGAEDARAAGVGHGDVAIGVAASGNTPYVIGAVEEAARLGAETVALVCARGSALERIARHCIAVDVGPELVGGSTRLKAGTAQKLVLNMLSTATFTKLGHVYDGLMVAVRPDNVKLQKRAAAIIRRITGAGDDSAQAMLAASGMDVRVAIVALAQQLSPEEARARLARSSGNLRQALAS
jgi:N-acetylmuramic acid 6-phosphate etherase